MCSKSAKRSKHATKITNFFHVVVGVTSSVVVCLCVCVCEPFLLVCLWLVAGVVVVSGVVKKYANAGARMME